LWTLPVRNHTDNIVPKMLAVPSIEGSHLSYTLPFFYSETFLFRGMPRIYNQHNGYVGGIIGLWGVGITNMFVFPFFFIILFYFLVMGVKVRGWGCCYLAYNHWCIHFPFKQPLLEEIFIKQFRSHLVKWPVLCLCIISR
jgi:hypothetical protein